MSSIFDALMFPYHDPRARQLHISLTKVFPTSKDAMLFVQQVPEIDQFKLLPDKPPFYLWIDILQLASQSGQLHRLVQVINDNLHASHPLRSFLIPLLADQAVEVESVPLAGSDGSSFLEGKDEVMVPEALLYHDDLTIQAGRLPALILTLQKLQILMPGVCRLMVSVHGYTKYGTGFRIGPDLILTNWHVLFVPGDGTRASAVTAEFDYEDDGLGGPLTPQNRKCVVDTIVYDKDDDWAVIKTSEALDDAWPEIKLSTTVQPVLHSSAFIIQHPMGDRKRVGYVRNQISGITDRVVHYLTDTQEGSSGAPVFDSEGKVIALHHAGGRPQEMLAKAPVKKNEGIRISRILEGLKRQGVQVP